ncbi:MAG: phosphomannomutase/phosphoglucomutase [Deferribacteres bacterium]|nr:phosphomannomutase/phosphoglucomutase [Deferribacteres bacterium]
MVKIRDTVFREYDIRGRVSDDELNIHSVETIARAFGSLIRREKGRTTAIVGYDSRKCSPDFRDAAVRGLNSTGCSTVDIGMVTTPVFYFAQYMLGIPSGIMITGSHNPDGWSGLKMADDFSSTLLSGDVRKIRDIIINNDFHTGHGRAFNFDGIKEAYISALAWRVKPGRRLRLAIDAGNGTAGIYAPALFRSAGFDVVEIFCELDPSFPNHFPNPSDIRSLEILSRKTVESGADIGLSFDGDGDRLGVVDEKGAVVSSDRVLILLARQILQEKPGAKIVFDVKCTRALIEDIEARGGVPVMCKTGHSYIKRRIHEEKAGLGGEHSGHIFIVDDYYGFDDGLFAGLKLAEYLSHQDKPFSGIMKTTPQYLSSPNIQVECPDERKYAVVESLVKEFKDEFGEENVIDINGARVNIADGWGLIRASSNLPVLVIMLEAATKEGYLEIKRVLKEKLEKFPEVGDKWENDIDPF